MFISGLKAAYALHPVRVSVCPVPVQFTDHADTAVAFNWRRPAAATAGLQQQACYVSLSLCTLRGRAAIIRSTHFLYRCMLLQMLLRRLQQTRPTKELRRDVLIGSLSADRGSSARPLSAGRAHVASTSSRQRPRSGTRPRPTSACTAAEHYPYTSRPATAFPSQPDDYDILTWQPEDF